MHFDFEEPVKYLLLYTALSFPLLASFIEWLNYTLRKVILCYSKQFKPCTAGNCSWSFEKRELKTGSDKLVCCSEPLMLLVLLMKLGWFTIIILFPYTGVDTPPLFLLDGSTSLWTSSGINDCNGSVAINYIWSFPALSWINTWAKSFLLLHASATGKGFKGNLGLYIQMQVFKWS